MNRINVIGRGRGITMRNFKGLMANYNDDMNHTQANLEEEIEVLENTEEFTEDTLYFFNLRIQQAIEDIRYLSNQITTRVNKEIKKDK